MYTPNRTDKIRNNSIYSQPQDINVFSISEFSLEYICCWSYASNDLTPSCATTQVSLDSPQQYTYFNITATTVHISQHYSYNSTHISTLPLQRYTYLNSTTTTVHAPQYYSYNTAHISTIQLQLRHDLLFPFQHGVYDAARLVHRLVHLLIFPLDDVLRELRQIEREVVFVGHRHVDTADLHTHTCKQINELSVLEHIWRRPVQCYCSVRTGPDKPAVAILFPSGEKDFLFSRASRPDLRPIRPET